MYYITQIDTMLAGYFDFGKLPQLKDDSKETYLEFRKAWKSHYKWISLRIRQLKNAAKKEARESSYGSPSMKTLELLGQHQCTARFLLALLSLVKSQNRIRLMREDRAKSLAA